MFAVYEKRIERIEKVINRNAAILQRLDRLAIELRMVMQIFNNQSADFSRKSQVAVESKSEDDDD